MPPPAENMKDVILVTGFGPFGEHKVNASWEAVKLLKKREIDNAEIVVEEIPVIYSYIEEQVPLLWKKYNPKVSKTHVIKKNVLRRL